jgi:hypothetical protein
MLLLPEAGRVLSRQNIPITTWVLGLVFFGVTLGIVNPTKANTGNPLIPVPSDSVQPAPPQPKTVFFACDLNLGAMGTINDNIGDNRSSVIMNSVLTSFLDIQGTDVQFHGDVAFNFARFAAQYQSPQTTVSSLNVTLRPSLWLNQDLKLFFQTYAQTQVASSSIDDTITTSPLDPIYLNESLYVGQSLSNNAKDGSTHIDATYGAGYAFEQTVTNNPLIYRINRPYVFNGELIRPLQSSLTARSGVIAVMYLNFTDNLTNELKFNLTSNSEMVAEQNFIHSISNAHAQTSLLVGLHYLGFGFTETATLIYDHNISVKRSLQQLLVFSYMIHIQ